MSIMIKSKNPVTGIPIFLQFRSVVIQNSRSGHHSIFIWWLGETMRPQHVAPVPPTHSTSTAAISWTVWWNARVICTNWPKSTWLAKVVRALPTPASWPLGEVTASLNRWRFPLCPPLNNPASAPALPFSPPHNFVPSLLCEGKVSKLPLIIMPIPCGRLQDLEQL